MDYHKDAQQLELRKKLNLTSRFHKPNCEGLKRRSVRQLTKLLTPEQSQARRLQQATYMAFQRDTETNEAAESRKRAVAERAQQRRLIFTRNTWEGLFDKAAFEYDETLDYESHKLIKIEAMNKECRFCGALKWKEDSAGMCCLKGSSPSFNRPAS
ncbi:uncharacterized protein TNCV_492431 [Trichonephila clavipes]|nr:uncharacterized protein TNCV_492431 [Trichonephila clavipes]